MCFLLRFNTLTVFPYSLYWLKPTICMHANGIIIMKTVFCCCWVQPNPSKALKFKIGRPKTGPTTTTKIEKNRKKEEEEEKNRLIKRSKTLCKVNRFTLKREQLFRTGHIRIDFIYILFQCFFLSLFSMCEELIFVFHLFFLTILLDR